MKAYVSNEAGRCHIPIVFGDGSETGWSNSSSGGEKCRGGGGGEGGDKCFTGRTNKIVFQLICDSPSMKRQMKHV